jgi:hypothetical protein
MLITTRAKVKTLLQQGGRTSRFDRGKYKWTGTIKDYVGLEIPDLDGIEAVFAEKRNDSWGPYVVLIAVHR